MLLQLWNETHKPNFFSPLFMNWDNSREMTDFVEQDKQYIFRMDLPGFRKEDVKVEVKDHTLIIEANRTQEYDESKDRVYRKERRALKIREFYHLPDNVLENKIQAKVEDGVLNVYLPKTEESKPKLISIN